MKPPPFRYAAPTSVEEVLDLLAANADAEPRVLAGGQSLVPLMNFRLAQPGFLVDLRLVEALTTLRTERDVLVIGAMVRQSAVERSPEVAFAVQADGAEIRTVEGLANGADLHPLQDEFWTKQGLQCGYCTPGMLMRACEIIEQNPDPSPEQVREGIASNLCRCTGYQFIIEAVCAAAGRMRGEEQHPDQTTMPTEAKA